MANLFDLINEECDRIAAEHKAIDQAKEAEFWNRIREKAKAEQAKNDAWILNHPEDLEETEEDEDEDEDE